MRGHKYENMGICFKPFSYAENRLSKKNGTYKKMKPRLSWKIGSIKSRMSADLNISESPKTVGSMVTAFTPWPLAALERELVAKCQGEVCSEECLIFLHIQLPYQAALRGVPRNDSRRDHTEYGIFRIHRKY